MKIPGPIDLSDRVKLQLSGPDRVRFLNGQVSNDVRRVDEHHTLSACVCSLKGKLDALVCITAAASAVPAAVDAPTVDDGNDDDSAAGVLLVDGPPELRTGEALWQRLDRYLIADQVELEDVTDRLALWHFLPGSDRPDLPGAVWKKSHRFGVEGLDLWLSRESAETLRAQLTAVSADSPEVEALRISARVPRWGAELSNDILPAEARLDERAIDFHKGCYTGQEVVSRIKSVGRVKRLLHLLRAIPGESAEADDMADPGSGPEIGDAVFPVDSTTSDGEGRGEGEVEAAGDPAKAPAGKSLGTLSSIARHPGDGRLIALAVLRRDGLEATGRAGRGETRLVSRGQSGNLGRKTAWEILEI